MMLAWLSRTPGEAGYLTAKALIGQRFAVKSGTAKIVKAMAGYRFRFPNSAGERTSVLVIGYRGPLTCTVPPL